MGYEKGDEKNAGNRRMSGRRHCKNGTGQNRGKSKGTEGIFRTICIRMKKIALCMMLKRTMLYFKISFQYHREMCIKYLIGKKDFLWHGRSVEKQEKLCYIWCQGRKKWIKANVLWISLWKTA